MENGEKDAWDELVEEREAPTKARRESDETRRQEEEATREQARLAREATEKVSQERWGKALAEAQAGNQVRDREMGRLAHEGDVDGLMAYLDHFLKDPDERFPKAMALIRLVLEEAVRKDPAKLYASLGARIVAWRGFLLIRSQYMAMNLIRKQDQEGGAPYGDLPQSVVDHWLPRISMLEKSIEETATVFARVDHAMKLGGKKAGKTAGEEHGRERHSQRSKSSGNPRQEKRAAEAPDHPPAPVADAGGTQAAPGASGQPAAA